MTMDDDDDDDVEILCIDGQPVEVHCQICNASFLKKSVAESQAHYEEHFRVPSNESRASPSDVIDLSSSTNPIRGGSISITKSKETGKQVESTSMPPSDKQNVFWYRSLDAHPPSNCTPALVPMLKQALLKSHARGQMVRAALCYEGVVHVGSEKWDLGWGCGYRNFLMVCSALMDQHIQPHYFPALDQPSPPGVRNLQKWIEDAWSAGYDAEGAADLKHRLVGTRKWIGTAELHVAFLVRGIPSRLVDFPHVASNASTILQWIVNYFSEASNETHEMRRVARVKTTVDEALRGASPVVVTDRMPLILQNKGHSRTIVGYERTKDGSINLLCFDPSRRPPSSIRNSALLQFTPQKEKQKEESTTYNPPNKPHRGLSPSKIINTVLHPRTHKEREAANTSSITIQKKRGSDEDVGRGSKRVRGGLRVSKDPAVTRREVIEILDDEDEVVDMQPGSDSHSPSPMTTEVRKAVRPEPDYTRVLEFFRLKPKKVGKKDCYQILYFPLEDLLTEQERWARRVVRAEMVH